jgi:hypothetical protein
MVVVVIMSLMGGDSKPVSVKSLALVAVIVTVVILAVLTCTAGIGRRMELRKIIKHVLATLAALLAVIGSLLQAVKAREKARHHEAASGDGTQPASEWKTFHDFEAQHFRSVGTIWYVVAASALVAAMAEGVDFFID